MWKEKKKMKFRKEKWVNLGVTFSEEKMQNVRSFMAENSISYKCKPEAHFGMSHSFVMTAIPPTWCIYVTERKDTVLYHQQLFCSKCRKEFLVNVKQFKMQIVKEPDPKMYC